MKNMTNKTTRRDFLKLASSLPLGLATSKTLEKLRISHQFQSEKQNILIIVFDAWSAYHISMYGYQRETTPNIARLAERAIVYHNHYAGGNFTTPGTASLLTGTLPWTHRATQPNGTVVEPYITNNIFGAFKKHYKIAYTHNPWANTLLQQFSNEIDELVPWFSLFLESYDEIIHSLFKNDDDIASLSWFRNTGIKDEGYAYSFFLSHIYETLREKKLSNLREKYPRGIPSIGRAETSFILDQAVNWIGERLTKIPQPFAGYFHFLPPHGPYRTSIKFVDEFSQDNYKPLEKPDDSFSDGKTYDALQKKRAQYDEFILYADDQFNIFFEHLKDSGLLENTWVILTSDHGEMFERGIDGHSNDAMYQPVIRVPLMIFEPGRTKGENIFTPTSAIDILPTALHITGQNIPDWAEGKILPPFTEQSQDINRSIYAVRANKIDKHAPITRTSTTLTKGRYKLHYYLGYEERGLPHEFIRLFDIESDMDEMVDLTKSHKEIASDLLAELKTKLDEVNKSYL